MALDTQVVELLGRQRLMGELLRDGLEVAVPTRDRGVDLIAYADLSQQVRSFAARPIQMKAYSTTGFGVAQKYKRIADLLLAYVWNLETPHEAVTFAMSYDEAVSVANDMGWTKTASWKSGAYSTSAPSKKLLARLERHKVTPGRWWKLVVGR